MVSNIEVEGTDETDIVIFNVLDYDAILRSISEFWRSLEPSVEEILVLEILDQGIPIPTAKSTSGCAARSSSRPGPTARDFSSSCTTTKTSTSTWAACSRRAKPGTSRAISRSRSPLPYKPCSRRGGVTDD